MILSIFTYDILYIVLHSISEVYFNDSSSFNFIIFDNEFFLFKKLINLLGLFITNSSIFFSKSTYFLILSEYIFGIIIFFKLNKYFFILSINTLIYIYYFLSKKSIILSVFSDTNLFIKYII